MAENCFYDPLLRVVFAEMKKPENRGRTLKGVFKCKRIGYFSDVEGEIHVDGRKEPIIIANRGSARRGDKFSGSMTDVAPWAYAYCSNLKSVLLPEGINEIPDGLFFNYGRYGEDNGVVGTVKIPETVTRIGKYAFSANAKLTEIELPEGVEEIDDYAFYRCSELTNVVVRGKLKRIGEGAFWGCDKLKRPELPASVEIGEGAFGSWDR